MPEFFRIFLEAKADLEKIQQDLGNAWRDFYVGDDLVTEKANEGHDGPRTA